MCPSSYIATLAGFLLVALAGSATAALEDSTPSPAVVLTNVAQVRNLTAAQAAQALPTRLRGVVVDESYPPARALILADQLTREQVDEAQARARAFVPGQPLPAPPTAAASTNAPAP